jgi:peptidoglycan/LPS O-acetylase OafA/YrhL
MEAKTATRNHWLDWLRVLAILFVFVYHSSRFFNMEDWHVKNPTWYPWVEVWNVFATSWMMPVIFVVSGASLYYAMGKGGFGKFVKDKALRLLVPWAVAVFTHAAWQVYLERITHGQFTGSFFQFMGQYFQGTFEGSNPASGNFAWHGMHLWYLLLLFVFSILLYPLMRWLKGGARGAFARFGDFLALPGAVYLLALPAVLMSMLLDPDGPVMSVENGGWAFVVYLWVTLAGFILVSHDGMLATVKRLRWVSLAVAVVSMVIVLYIRFISFADNPVTFGMPLLTFFLGLRALCSWFCILAAVGFCMRYLDYSNAFVRYANEAVLPFYILHQTVLLTVGYFVVSWPIPDLLKWAIILVASFAIIMALYEFLVRRFNVLRFLFGMKVLRKAPAAQPQQPAPAGRAL